MFLSIAVVIVLFKFCGTKQRRALFRGGAKPKEGEEGTGAKEGLEKDLEKNPGDGKDGEGKGEWKRESAVRAPERAIRISMRG